MIIILNSPSVLIKQTDRRTFNVGGEEYNISFFESMARIADHWPSESQCENIFLSTEYLQALEETAPEGMSFLYGILSDNNEVNCGYYYFQYKRFNARKSINYSRPKHIGQQLLNFMKQGVSSALYANGLISGNLLVTGEHGKWCDGLILEIEQQRELDAEVQQAALEFSKMNKRRIGFILGKDYETTSLEGSCIDWNNVRVQPNMILHLKQEWPDMAAYLNAMKSKYRKRINSAMRKVEKFNFVEADLDLIKIHIDRVYQLYLEIVERAPFNMFILSKEYFITLKDNLNEKCDVTFVFDGDNLIAFQFNIENGKLYESHFLGYDHNYLRSHDLYLNLLLNTVKLAFTKRVEQIIFSRTAMQIKSSIGAVPEELYLYLNVRNKTMNKLVKLAFNNLNPPVVFDQRHPFK